MDNSSEGNFEFAWILSIFFDFQMRDIIKVLLKIIEIQVIY